MNRLLAPLACLLVAACQTTPPPAPTGGKSAALSMMEQVAIAANRCWFGSKDEAFRPYRFANELNSFSGRPRFLLVPARSPEARPLLVVQAEGTPARLQAFGPLMEGEHAERISSDLRRWSSGEQGCAAAA
ncbi:MAG: hypothetical protein K5872_21790 [Rhizobiaceae bacterium]|nr:hypothetical protein [Rhizobiaceae bacterium]MCV0408852.1 hypothetical protein [Rhizobiaceae bacterium]